MLIEHHLQNRHRKFEPFFLIPGRWSQTQTISKVWDAALILIEETDVSAVGTGMESVKYYGNSHINPTEICG